MRALPPRPVSYVETLSAQSIAEHIRARDCFFFQVYVGVWVCACLCVRGCGQSVVR